MSDERKGRPSASSAEIFYNCAGAINAWEQVVGKDEDTPERLQGEEIHEALESEDFTGLDEEGKTIAEKLTDMIRAAHEQWLGEFAEAGETSREQRFWVRDRKTLAPLISAKLDWCVVGRTHGMACDFKSGYIPVTPSARNIQCRIQALCLFHEYPELKHIRVATAQYRFVGKFDATDYSLDDLKRAEEELLFNLWRSSQLTAPRVPGDHCRYCKARGVCPEAGAYALLPASMVPALKPADIGAMVSRLSLEQLSAIRSRKSLIENIISAVDGRLRGCTEEELAGVGLRLQGSGNITTVTDVQGAFAILKDAGLIDGAEFTGCCKLVLGRLEETVVPRLEGTKVAAKKKLLAMLGPVTETHPKLASIRAIKEPEPTK